MSYKNILIVGAGGYLGTEMVAKFLNNKYKVAALDRYFFGEVFDDITDENLQVKKNDIRWLNESDLDGIDVVINLAAISNDPAAELNPKITQEINNKGAVKLAKLAKAAGVKKYILASSCSVYGQGQGELTEKSSLAPVSEYARSKIAAEKDLFKLNDIDFSVTCLRMGTLYGLSIKRMRFDLIVNLMTLHAWKNNKIFIMGGGKQWRPLLHIKDAVEAFFTVATEDDSKLVSGEVFNVGATKENYQVYQVAHAFSKHFPQIEIEKAPDDADKRSYRVSFEKIKKQLNFKTQRTIDDGIKEIKEGLDGGMITDDIRTKTLGYYQYLLEADKVLSRVKLKNKLF